VLSWFRGPCTKASFVMVWCSLCYTGVWEIRVQILTSTISLISFSYLGWDIRKNIHGLIWLWEEVWGRGACEEVESKRRKVVNGSLLNKTRFPKIRQKNGQMVFEHILSYEGRKIRHPSVKDCVRHIISTIIYLNMKETFP
jgi:hypothetical protein